MPKVTAIVSKKSWKMSLIQGEEYELIGIEDIGSDQAYFRIVDEKGDPPLYPCCYFLEEDILPPADWIRKDLGESRIDYYPFELSGRYFFDHHSDDKPEEVRLYNEYLRKIGWSPREKSLEPIPDNSAPAAD